MKNTEQEKVKPQPGMAVVWESEGNLNRNDAAFLDQKLRSRFGEGPFKIHSVIPQTRNYIPNSDWSVTITTNGTIITNENLEDDGPVGESSQFNWHWLQPLPRPKLQVGTSVTWASIDEIDSGNELNHTIQLIETFNELYGQGPFIVACQDKDAVYLVDSKGFPLDKDRPLEDQKIHRSFLKAQCE